MNKLFKTLVIATTIVASHHVFAEKNEGIKAELAKNYPSTVFTQVNDTPLKGVYEVVMGKNIAYTDKTGRYFIFGSMFDMKNQTDMTTNTHIEKIEVGFPSAERLRDAIKTVVGNGERKLVVFSDPDCPYCQQLERNLLAIDNVTIYTFLYPLESLHPTAKSKAISIWCSDNPTKSYHDYILNGIEPKLKTCETPIDRNIEYAASLGISGTPSLIFEDGSSSAGAMPTNELERLLQEAHKKVSKE